MEPCQLRLQTLVHLFVPSLVFSLVHSFVCSFLHSFFLHYLVFLLLVLLSVVFISLVFLSLFGLSSYAYTVFLSLVFLWSVLSFFFLSLKGKERGGKGEQHDLNCPQLYLPVGYYGLGLLRSVHIWKPEDERPEPYSYGRGKSRFVLINPARIWHRMS